MRLEEVPHHPGKEPSSLTISPAPSFVKREEKNYLPTEGLGGKYRDFTEKIQGFPYLPSGIFPIWLNHGEISEMLMSLKIHWLKWQIKVLLRMR